MTRIDMLKWLKGWKLVVLIVGREESSIWIIRLRMSYYFLLFMVVDLSSQGEGIDLRW
jgi:hypothetical protein